MTDEEKQAIDDLFPLTHINGYINLYDLKKANIYTSDLKRWQNGVKVLLNLIEKQQEELEKKDEEIRCWKSLHDEQLKIIDEMAKHIKTTAIYECPSKDCEDDGSITCEECIKEYFKKKVEDK